ncbi:MAG: phosphotransferase [Candidatus Thiodiazotropha sp.]
MKRIKNSEKPSKFLNVAWHLLVSGEHCDRILVDHRCGEDLILKLAAWYDQVDVVLNDFKQIQVLNRSVDEGNIYILVIDHNKKLPFNDDLFDVVILSNELLDKNYNLICESHRILKESGTLYFHTDNRFSARNFIQILRPPFDLGDIKSGSNLIKYKRMLAKVGFRKINSFSFYPNHETPINIDITEESKKSAIKRHDQSVSDIFKRIIQGTSLYRRHLADTYGICSVKNSGKNHIDLIIEQINKQDGTSAYKLYNGEIIITVKGSLLFKLSCDNNKQEGIVKVALNQQVNDQLQQNYKQIEAIASDCNIPDLFKQSVPRLLGQGECKGYNYYFEELKSGVPAVNFRSSADILERILINVTDLITILHANTCRQLPQARSSALHQLHEKIETMDALTEQKYTLEFRYLSQLLTESIYLSDIPMVFQKGDCSIHNVLVNDDYSVSALIDWDQSEVTGFPLVDVINLIESFKRHSLRIGMGKIVRDYLLPMKLTDLEKELLTKYCEKLGISKDLYKTMCYVYWIEHVSAQMHVHDKDWIKNNIHRITKYLSKHKTNLKVI